MRRLKVSLDCECTISTAKAFQKLITHNMNAGSAVRREELFIVRTEKCEELVHIPGLKKMEKKQ